MRWLILSCSTLSLTACSSQFLVDSSPETTDEAFTSATHTYDVPRDLLVALGWTVTRLEMREIREHGGESAVHHGIMGLAEGAPSGPSMADAAAELGVSLEQMERNEFLNILGAAAELRAYADHWEVESGTDLESLSDWAPVISWYAGSDDPSMQRSFARDVYRWIE